LARVLSRWLTRAKARRPQVKASNATPPRAHLTLLQYILETAPEAHPAKVLT
jgi:hypothetical protein